jgi:hypothetical protein
MLYHRLIIGLHYSLGHHGIDFVTKFTEEQITVSLLNSQKMETILNRIFFYHPDLSMPMQVIKPIESMIGLSSCPCM